MIKETSKFERSKKTRPHHQTTQERERGANKGPQNTAPNHGAHTTAGPEGPHRARAPNEPGPNGPQSGSKGAARQQQRQQQRRPKGPTEGGPAKGPKRETGTNGNSSSKAARKGVKTFNFMRVRDEQVSKILSSCFMPVFYFAQPSSQPASRCAPLKLYAFMFKSDSSMGSTLILKNFIKCSN